MLPLWRDEVRIALCHDRVTLARVSRRWRPAVTAKHVVHCAGEETPDWKRCIAALQQILRDSAAQNADATVIISNHFVRYALVPWSEHLVSDDEKRAWVKHQFVEIYGEGSGVSDYRWSEDRPDGACVASAIDSEFIGEIRATLDPSSLRLRSIQPYLMTVFNRCRRHAKSGSAWILIPEAGRVCIGAINDGSWRRITSRKLDADWHTALPLVLERELLLADAATAPAVILAYAPDVPNLGLTAWDEVPLKVLAAHALPGYSPGPDAHYAMALTGLI